MSKFNRLEGEYDALHTIGPPGTVAVVWFHILNSTMRGPECDPQEDNIDWRTAQILCSKSSRKR